MNDIVNDRKGHNIVNDSFAHKPDGFLVTIANNISTLPRKPEKNHGILSVREKWEL